MLYEKSCGGVIYRKSHGNLEILLIKHINSGHWSFPKGHIEANETEQETALREIKEETGIDVVLDPSFRETVHYSPKKDINKEVVYFLAKPRQYEIVIQEEEIADARWVEINHACTVLTYENDKIIVGKVRNAIKDRIL
ncbi:MAG: NUDIX domain-containing protein [Oscillospiraceae bacterium]|nr:NUDIX domain-containing protein [Oscillospiraceae bacterium]